MWWVVHGKVRQVRKGKFREPGEGATVWRGSGPERQQLPKGPLPRLTCREVSIIIPDSCTASTSTFGAQITHMLSCSVAVVRVLAANHVGKALCWTAALANN